MPKNSARNSVRLPSRRSESCPTDRSRLKPILAMSSTHLQPSSPLVELQFAWVFPARPNMPGREYPTAQSVTALFSKGTQLQLLVVETQRLKKRIFSHVTRQRCI